MTYQQGGSSSTRIWSLSQLRKKKGEGASRVLSASHSVSRLSPVKEGEPEAALEAAAFPTGPDILRERKEGKDRFLGWRVEEI